MNVSSVQIQIWSTTVARVVASAKLGIFLLKIIAINRLGLEVKLIKR